MKNEALIKVYLEEKDKLINNLEKELKEYFNFNTLEDFNSKSKKGSIQPVLKCILKCYNIVYHICLKAFIKYDKNSKTIKVKYSYSVTLNHIDVILDKVHIETDLKAIAKEVVEASIKDLDKRI